MFLSPTHLIVYADQIISFRELPDPAVPAPASGSAGRHFPSVCKVNVLQHLRLRLAPVSDGKDTSTKTVVRCEMNLKQLKYVEAARLAAESEALQKKDELAQRRRERPFRTVAMVDEWNQQYDSALGRYRFLVLNGESQVGKTRFARSLVSDPDRVWYMDVSDGVPDLRSFRGCSSTCASSTRCHRHLPSSAKNCCRSPTTLPL